MSNCRMECIALRRLASEIPNSIDKSLFESPDFNFEKKYTKAGKGTSNGIIPDVGLHKLV